VSPAAPQFMFDFGSPNAFLSHEAIPAIERRTGARFEYVPILLGGIFKATNNKSPAETLEKYVDAAFHHMWVEPKKMDDPGVAMQALTESGLDAAKLFARAQEPEIKAKLIENTQSAVERGAFGSPTFFVGNEMFFGKEQLREVEELVSGR